MSGSHTCWSPALFIRSILAESLFTIFGSKSVWHSYLRVPKHIVFYVIIALMNWSDVSQTSDSLVGSYIGMLLEDLQAFITVNAAYVYDWHMKILLKGMHFLWLSEPLVSNALVSDNRLIVSAVAVEIWKIMKLFSIYLVHVQRCIGEAEYTLISAM